MSFWLVGDNYRDGMSAYPTKKSFRRVDIPLLHHCQSTGIHGIHFL
jgi:hypothetical protein